MAHSQYNFKNPAVRRLMKEAQELKDPTDQYSAHPLEDNLFEWHFTVRGPSDSEFEGGIYHGRIVLPPEYPMKPPSILLLTPNGRFQLNKKICLSISGYHPESWQPSWSIRTAILAIIGFMPTRGEGAIGALDYSPEERKILARKSQTWSCQSCGPIKQRLKNPGESTQKSENEERDEELARQINFSKPKPKKESDNASSSADPESPKESSVPSSSAADGLRHRHATPSQPQEESAAPTTSPPQSTPLPRTPSSRPPVQRQDDSTPLMLIIVLSVVFAVLLLRRLDRAYDLTGNIGHFF